MKMNKEQIDTFISTAILSFISNSTEWDLLDLVVLTNMLLDFTGVRKNANKKPL